MRAIKTLMAFLLAAALMQNFALAQKREFKAAIKNEVYSFDGYYYVDLSKAAISKDELFSFAKKNGYYIEAYATDKVVQFGESMIGVTKVLMLPEGAQPNPEKGHLNPADEPYKSINAVVNEMIRKGPDKTGVYYRNFGDSGFKIKYKDEINAVIQAHNCNWTAYKTDAGWGRYAEVYTELYFVDRGSMSGALLANSFSGVTLSKKMKTGMAKLDPDKNEWVDGILWTGDIVDGKISGKGYGAKVIDPDSKQGLVIDGSFQNGLPSGDVRYRYGEYDALNKLSLYGQYNVHDFEHKSAGIHISLTPTDDPNVLRITRSRITKDIVGKTDEHNTRMGFVNRSFQTMSWMPGNTEVVKTLADGSSVIRHRKKGYDNSGGAIFYDVSEKVDYVVSPDGKTYLADTERQSLLAKYDRIMSFWDETMKPYNGQGSSYGITGLKDALSQWGEYLKQIDSDILTQKPLDYVKSQRSNFAQFELLQQLGRLNALVFPNESLSESFIYNNPGYRRNCKDEADKIMEGLRNNSGFNSAYKEKVFADYEDRLNQEVKYYAGIYSSIAEKRRQEKAEKEIQKAFEISEFGTYDPSGELVDLGFFSSYKTHSKDGKVTLRNNAYAVYNIVYTPSGEIDCYRLLYSSVGLSNKDYKSFNAMVNDVSNASLNSK